MQKASWPTVVVVPAEQRMQVNKHSRCSSTRYFFFLVLKPVPQLRLLSLEVILIHSWQRLSVT